MRDLIAAGILACAAHLTAGCEPCDRDGCEKVNERASSDGTSAIAGALASESDVEANGCTECPLASARLSIWSTPALVSDEAKALAVVSAGPATFSVSAQGTYRQAVPPGAYLLCERECVAVAVEVQVEVLSFDSNSRRRRSASSRAARSRSSAVSQRRVQARSSEIASSVPSSESHASRDWL